MKKNIKRFSLFFIIILIIIIFLCFVYKKVKSGNNIIKSNDDLIEYILNISSYEAKIEVIINSNKTTNKYILEQYYQGQNYSKQIVKKPENIENLEIIYDGKNLEIKNINLGLTKIYNNYQELNENLLWLNYFLENCKKELEIEENENEIMIKSSISDYNYNGKLYIDKKTNLPTKLEILDNSNNCKIYIIYKEIKLNSEQENNIFAVITKDIKKIYNF